MAIYYFILWVLIQYSIIYFVAHIVPALATGKLFCWLLGPCDILPLSWGLCLVCCLLFVVVVLPLLSFSALQDAPDSSCNISSPSHFSEEPSFLLLEKSIRN